MGKDYYATFSLSYLHGTKTDIKVAEHSIQSKPERKHMHKSRTTYMITKITREHAERRGRAAGDRTNFCYSMQTSKIAHRLHIKLSKNPE